MTSTSSAIIKRPAAFGHQHVLYAYAILFLALTFPYWLGGEIASPYRPSSEIAVAGEATTGRIENRKFSDYWNSYVPEIDGLLSARRSGWLALWTDKNELGRPLYHLSGFSPAYPPTWVISFFTSDPQRIITVLSLGYCFFAGLFVLLLCRELSLAPVAGLVSGGSMAASPLFMYWLTFPMFPAVWCWTAASLFAVTRLASTVDLVASAILAFSIYSLLMTAYPQAVIYQAYILVGYGAYLGFRLWRSKGVASLVRYVTVALAAVAVGVVLTLPVYLDVLYAASQSARVSPDISFFAAALPRLDSLIDVTRLFATSTFPELFGNPIASSYPFEYNGLSVTPLIVFIAIFGLSQCWRKVWGWLLAIGVLGSLTFVHPLFALAVGHLGFRLSRFSPIASMILPATMVFAQSADSFLKEESSQRYSRAVRHAAIGTVGCLLVALCFGFGQGVGIRWGAVLATIFIVALLVVPIKSVRPGLLVAALTIVGVSVSFPLMLRQPSPQTPMTSPLIDKVLADLPEDSRFATAAPGLEALPPNLNAIFGIASVHSYDSLSPRRYQDLIARLGGQVQTYGRWNGMISPVYEGLPFWMSNIGLILSPTAISDSNLESNGKEGNVNIFIVKSRMGCCRQFSSFIRTDDGVYLYDKQDQNTSVLHKTVDDGDVIEIEVNKEGPSLLVLSQRYHRDWSANVQTSAGWAGAQTLPVNSAFQGVALPAGAQKVRLQFLPYVRSAWLAHVFWLLVLTILVAQACWRRRGRLVSSEGRQ